MIHAISKRIMVVSGASLLCGSALISSCSAWDIIGAVVKPSPGIAVETEIVAGNKHQELASGAVVGKKETTTNTAETITQTYNTIQHGKSIWDMFLMMLMSMCFGWIVLPDGARMWKMVKKVFRFLNKKPRQN